MVSQSTLLVLCIRGLVDPLYAKLFTVLLLKRHKHVCLTVTITEISRKVCQGKITKKKKKKKERRPRSKKN